jgi:hypothetical protein
MMPTLGRRAIAPSFAALLLASAATAQSTLHLACPRHEAGAKYGWSVAGVPDVNGDGCGDLLIGSESESVGAREDAGRVYVVSGATGQHLRVIVPPTSQPIGTFGWAVGGMPDVTGDGRGDILIGGIWETDPQGRICGRAYLYNGSSGQLVRAWITPTRQENACFGWAVSSVPDTNGDGVADVIISAPFEDVGGQTAAGRVYVYSGATGQYIRTLWSPNYQSNGSFGYSVAGLADVNGDGRGDIAIGAPWERTGSSPLGAGRVYIVSGSNGQLIRVHRSATEVQDGNFGFSIAAVGDSNGDGVHELLVGAPHETGLLGQISSGRVYLFSGANGVGLRRISSPGATHQGNFGSAVGATAYSDGSPTDRMIVGAPEEVLSGRAYIIGPPGVQTRTIGSPFPMLKGKYGSAVAGVPDCNNDGVGDASVGANSESGHGRAYVYR